MRTILELVAAVSCKVVIRPVNDVCSILSLLSIGKTINGEMMHTKEIPILQHCQ